MLTLLAQSTTTSYYMGRVAGICLLIAVVVFVIQKIRGRSADS